MASLKKMSFGALGVVITVTALVLIIFQLVGVGSFFTIVEAGSVEVQKTFGSVNDQELNPGFNLKLPFTQVIRFNTRTQQYTMSVLPSNSTTGTVDTLSALTIEGLSIDLDLSVLYRIIPEKASDVYKTIGVNYQEQVVRPLIRGTIREVVARYEAKDVYSEKRSDVIASIMEDLGTQLNERGFILEDMLIRHVQLPVDLETSIAQKLKAEQDSLRYKFLLEQEEKEAQRKKIEAQGQADAQSIVSESLTDKYLQFLYINSLENREGTIYVPTQNGMPLFKAVQ